METDEQNNSRRKRIELTHIRCRKNQEKSTAPSAHHGRSGTEGFRARADQLGIFRCRPPASRFPILRRGHEPGRQDKNEGSLS